MNDSPIIFINNDEVDSNDELHKVKDQLGIDGSYCIVCNKNNEKFLKLEGCFCKSACAVSDYDKCRFKNEAGTMMIQRTVGEYKDEQTHKSQREKRKR